MTNLVSAVLEACAWRSRDLSQDPTQVLLTLSPIRHWRDGAQESALSKATLLVALHQAMEQLRAAGVTAAYFPSYEIMMDDLRGEAVYGSLVCLPACMYGDTFV